MGSALPACLLTLLAFGISSMSAAQTTYKAAVLEHSVIYLGTLEETYSANLRAYRGNATVAARKGADIIVFPEYGIGRMGRIGRDPQPREELATVAQEARDPEERGWVPCDEPSPQANIRILSALSCIAIENNIAVVANLISRVACNSSVDKECPADDQFLYNTNAIFAKNGSLVGWYRKHHLFRETNLDPGPKDGLTIVDLGFARIATVVCFDLLNADPLLNYVNDHGIKNLAYPTNWVDNLPFLTAIQTFAGVAHGLGINILAANLHVPMEGSMGSGFYSGSQGPLAEVYDLSTPSKLLIAEIPVNPPAVVRDQSAKSECHEWVKGNVCRKFDPQAANFFADDNDKVLYESIPASEPTSDLHQIWWIPIDNTAFVYLEEDAAKLSVCQDGACCEVEYKFENRDKNVHYALSAFSGYFSRELPLFAQACTLIRCETRNVSTCGQLPKGDTSTRFSTLELSGDYNTESIFPNVLSTKLKNIKPDQWKFTHARSCKKKSCKRTTGVISVDPVTDDPIFVMRILGRIYDRDSPDSLTASRDASSALPPLSYGALLAILLCMLLI